MSKGKRAFPYPYPRLLLCTETSIRVLDLKTKIWVVDALPDQEYIIGWMMDEENTKVWRISKGEPLLVQEKTPEAFRVIEQFIPVIL